MNAKSDNRQFSKARLVPLDEALLRIAMATARDDHTARYSQFDEPLMREQILAKGRAVAMIEAGYLLGAGGVVASWEGRAEAWLVICKCASRRQIVSGMRIARRWLDALQTGAQFGRLEIFINANHAWRASFAAALGFDEPAVRLRAWGPQASDYFLHARVRNGGAS